MSDEKFISSYSQSYLTKWTNLGIISSENENFRFFSIPYTKYNKGVKDDV